MSGHKSRTRSGFTLIEVITCMVVGLWMVMALAGLFRTTLRGHSTTADRSDRIAEGRKVMHLVRSLLPKAIWPEDSRFHPRPFRNPPPRWEGSSAQFFADLEGDGQLEWVWIWVDPTSPHDPHGEISPRPPYLKVAAFKRYPPDPASWADHEGSFFRRITGDPSRYQVVAADLSAPAPERQEEARRGFTLQLPPGDAGATPTLDQGLARVSFSTAVDRDQDGRIRPHEPTIYLAEAIQLFPEARPPGHFPDPAFTSTSEETVAASALTDRESKYLLPR